MVFFILRVLAVKVNPMVRRSEKFSDSIKEVRRKLELSQEALAQALGVSFATVNRWENGRTAPSKLAQRQLEQFCTLKRKKGELTK